MPRTIVYNRGDVVLVNFVFSDESGMKRRPAVVISSSAFHQTRQEIVVAAITSNVARQRFGDHLIADWRGAGLLFPSLVTGIIRTIDRAMIDRKLGSMGRTDLEAVARELRQSLGL